jgi:tRNA dimethylallyltransferase
MMSTDSVLCLVGPTAVGKTSLAIELAQRSPIEVISVDSAMVYRGMDIGTAKPTKEERCGVVHHLIDVCEPTQAYSVGQFVADATRCIQEVRSRGKTPVLVGGTMMYVHALQHGLATLPQTSDEVRAYWAQFREERGVDALWQALCRIDPDYAAGVKPQDKQRIERALAVYTQSNKTMSQWLAEDQARLKAENKVFKLHVMAMRLERPLLLARIEARVASMFAQGFMEEARLLYQSVHRLSAPASRLIGYKQAFKHFDTGVSSEDELQQAIIIATRQLAKRQMTWLRSWSGGLCWIEASQEKKMQADQLGRAMAYTL